MGTLAILLGGQWLVCVCRGGLGVAQLEKLRIEEQKQGRARSRDGNGYITVGYWPPISVPARTKFYPSGYPYPYTGRQMLPYPYPKNIPENYIQISHIHMKNNSFQTKIGVSMEENFKESSTIYILGGIN